LRRDTEIYKRLLSASTSTQLELIRLYCNWCKSKHFIATPRIKLQTAQTNFETHSTSGFRIPKFYIFHSSIPHSQPPIQWVLGALSLGIKRLGREADRQPPSSAEINECVQLYHHSPNTPSWRGTQFKKSEGTILHLPLPLQFCIP